jgi:hypothetical protein
MCFHGDDALCTSIDMKRYLRVHMDVTCYVRDMFFICLHLYHPITSFFTWSDTLHVSTNLTCYACV